MSTTNHCVYLNPYQALLVNGKWEWISQNDTASYNCGTVEYASYKIKKHIVRVAASSLYSCLLVYESCCYDNSTSSDHLLCVHSIQVV